MKEHREKWQEEKLKSPEMSWRQRAGSLVPDRRALVLLLRVWGCWAAVHGEPYTSQSDTWAE